MDKKGTDGTVCPDLQVHPLISRYTNYIMLKTYGHYNTNILMNVYIREEDAAPSVFDVQKLSKVTGISGCVGKTVLPFDKLCAKTKSLSSVGKVSSINKLVSDIRKYFRQDTNIKKYKHYTNVPATSYQLLHGLDSVACIEVRAHTSLDAGWPYYVMCSE